MHNPARTQAAALNLAAGQAALIGAAILVRADAHAHYPEGFVGNVCAALSAREADSVVVPLIARSEEGTAWQNAAARLQHSWLGHGGARHRTYGRSGWVDHGHHAAFRLDRYLALGGYDDRFLAAEDVDFDWRLAAARGRIWLEAETQVGYVPRCSARALFKQMFRNGRARCQVALKHRRRLGLRQILPAVVTAVLLASIFVAPVIGSSAAIPGLIYGATTIVFAFSDAGSGVNMALRVAWLAIVSHIGFGCGLLAGLAQSFMSHSSATTTDQQPA